MTAPSQSNAEYLRDQFRLILSIPSNVEPGEFDGYVVPSRWEGRKLLWWNSFMGLVSTALWAGTRVYDLSGGTRIEAMRSVVTSTIEAWNGVLAEMHAAGERLKVRLQGSVDLKPRNEDLETFRCFYFNVVEAFHEGGGSLLAMTERVERFIKCQFASPEDCKFRGDIFKEVEDAEGYHCFNQLESLLEGRVPLKHLLTIDDEVKKLEEIQNFVGEVAYYFSKGNLTIRVLIKALMMIVKNSDHTDQVGFLSKLFFILHEQLAAKKCRIFDQKDPRYCREVDAKLVHEGKKIELGQEFIDSQKVGTGEHRVFKIQGNDSAVLKVSTMNQARLLMESYRDAKEGIHSFIPKIISIDGQGFSVVEKISAVNLADLWIWDVNKKRAEERFASLIAFLKGLGDNFPSELSPSLIFFDQKNKLMFMRSISKGTFNFDAIVKFIKTIVVANEENNVAKDALFEKIMIRSGLSSHPLVRQYEEVLRSVLHEEAKMAEFIVTNASNTELVSKIQSLRDEADITFKKCMDKAKEYDFEEGAMEYFETNLKNKIIDYYTHFGTMPCTYAVNFETIFTETVRFRLPRLKEVKVKNIFSDLYEQVTNKKAWENASQRRECVEKVCKKFGIFNSGQITAIYTDVDRKLSEVTQSK